MRYPNSDYASDLAGLFDDGLRNFLAEKSSELVNDDYHDQATALMSIYDRIMHLDRRQNDLAPDNMPVPAPLQVAELAGEEGEEGEGEGMTSEY